jgi:hypothetical protein
MKPRVALLKPDSSVVGCPGLSEAKARSVTFWATASLWPRHPFKRFSTESLGLFLTMSLAFLAVPGCGRNQPIAIHGTVTLDGRALERGRIEFEPADGRGPITAAEIVEGEYKTKAMPGKKTIRITGGKVIGRRPFSEDPASPPVEDIQPLLGPDYNTNSALTREIARGRAAYDFELKSLK